MAGRPRPAFKFAILIGRFRDSLGIFEPWIPRLLFLPHAPHFLSFFPRFTTVLVLIRCNGVCLTLLSPLPLPRGLLRGSGTKNNAMCIYQEKAPRFLVQVGYVSLLWAMLGHAWSGACLTSSEFETPWRLSNEVFSLFYWVTLLWQKEPSIWKHVRYNAKYEGLKLIKKKIEIDYPYREV